MTSPVLTALDLREPPSRQALRYALAGLLAILLQLLAMWIFTFLLSAGPEAPEEITVPIVFESPAPDASPTPPVEEALEKPTEEPVEEPEKEVPDDAELFRFDAPDGPETEPPDRPVGPRDEIAGPPKPREGAGYGLDEPPPDRPLPEPPRETVQKEEEEEPEPVEEPEETAEQSDEPSPGEEPAEESGEVVAPAQPEAEKTPEEAGEEPLPKLRDEGEKVAPSPLPKPRLLDKRPPPLSVPRQPQRVPDIGLEVKGAYFGDLRFDSRDYDWSDYHYKVYWAIYRAWLRELWNNRARFGRDQLIGNLDFLDGEVRIRFTLHRDGSVSGLEVLAPSVMPTLDQASLGSISGAVLPPLPDDFPRDSEGVTFRYMLRGFPSAQHLEYRLRYGKAAGEF